METHLTYDNKGRQLGILFRERLTTDQNLQLKVASAKLPPSEAQRLTIVLCINIAVQAP